ncbi:hypothetical protein BCV72DRAFT_270197 [Rhizopus microsporus var. microsporus]|uniref:Uncharacterized protein n=1 Tax=Rhizopus microsporus var. microsporus TaxID=86635 RepID=A0A1X0RBS3_RHIZD|nr:hypothetical protein BCV72DRAFT_270197 [Rhizopus microsporus var. microsporus]
MIRPYTHITSIQTQTNTYNHYYRIIIEPIMPFVNMEIKYPPLCILLLLLMASDISRIFYIFFTP